MYNYIVMHNLEFLVHKRMAWFLVGKTYSILAVVMTIT